TSSPSKRGTPDMEDETLDGGRHPDQLVPVAMPYHNRIMHGPEGTDVQDVSTYVGPDPTGRYAMTALAYTPANHRQREMLANGAHVTLHISQVPMPPVALVLEGPFCDLHRVEIGMGWPAAAWRRLGVRALSGGRKFVRRSGYTVSHEAHPTRGTDGR